MFIKGYMNPENAIPYWKKYKHNIKWSYLEETIKFRIFIIKHNVVYGYLGYIIIIIKKQLIGNVSLINVKSGKSTSINKKNLSSRSNDVNLISEEVLNSLDGQTKLSEDHILLQIHISQ